VRDRNNDEVTGESEQLVGRARELAELAVIVGERRGGVVLVAGEAGIGESRLVAEAVREVHSPVVWGACWDGDGAPPFWPWVPVIRACLASEAGAVWRAQPDPSVAEVMALLPDEASLRLLGFAARGLLDESVVIVGTYRDDEIGPDHPLSAVAAELAGRLRHLQLSGLDADELAALVRSQPAGDGVWQRSRSPTCTA
jgi:predicted ATPase